MKFSAKTVMKTATFRDLSLGRTQTTLVEYPLSGFFSDSDHYQLHTLDNVKTYLGFFAVLIAFVYSLYNLVVVWRTRRTEETESQQEEFLAQG